MKPTVAVLYAPGINCHEETAFAVERADLAARIVNFQDVLTGDDSLCEYQALIIPGGFSWGDHLGAGRVFGVHLVDCVADQLELFASSGKPILGICNGFQVLVETGLLPGRTIGVRQAALLTNRSAHFESRWVELLVHHGNCMWTRALEGHILRMPVAHGEGRLFWQQGQTAAIRPVVSYTKDGEPTEEYPANPNGSPGGIAGIADGSGLVFGLMPHPERATLPWHGSTDGMWLFGNLDAYLKS